jgi:hypothetical protein
MRPSVRVVTMREDSFQSLSIGTVEDDGVESQAGEDEVDGNRVSEEASFDAAFVPCRFRSITP